jgi:hypothetical protein
MNDKVSKIEQHDTKGSMTYVFILGCFEVGPLTLLALR